MAWIDVVGEASAEGELREVYDGIAGARGKLSNIMRVHSLRPAAMKSHMDLYLAIMFSGSGVSRPDREMIAAVVSQANNCPYCVNHHEEALRYYWRDDDRIRSVIRQGDYRSLDARQAAMLEYATKLTHNPEAMDQADVATLRDAGLADRDILDVNLIISYFNFVNRIALGLGVTFDADEMTGFKY